MIPNINTLINNSPNYKRFHHNIEAQYIYTNILCNPKNIIAMKEACLLNKPALVPVINEIEQYFDSIHNPTFDICSDLYARSYIGRMVSIILNQYGFKKKSTNSVPNLANSKYFSRASKYYIP